MFKNLCAVALVMLCAWVDAAEAARTCRDRGLRKGRGKIAYLTVLDPGTLRPIENLKKIRKSAVIDLADLEDGALVLKAKVRRKHRCRVRSVRFSVNAASILSLTTSKPYLFGSNTERDLNWRPEAGTYAIQITPFKKKNGRGRKGRKKDFTLTVIDSRDTPPPPTCSAGPNKIMSSTASGVQLQGLCEFENVRNVSWRYVSGTSTWEIADGSTLSPTVSGLTAGIHHFELSLDSDEGSFTDTVWVAVSRARNPYNFSADIVGTEHVVRGHSAYFELQLQQTAGGQERLHIAVAGLPEGASVRIPEWEETCCTNDNKVYYGWDVKDTVLRIDTSSGSPTGQYLLLISIGSGGKIKTIAKRLVVEEPPAALPRNSVGSIPAIPLLARWQSNMAIYGNKWCTDPNQNTTWEGNVWYYDGTRVFYQIADYTGNTAWKSCLSNTLSIYRNQIYSASPGIQGWRVFPHGLYRHFQETSDTTSRNAILKLATDSTFASYGGSADAAYSRETAYVIHAYLHQEKLGFGAHERFERAVDFALGHLDQLARSRLAPVVKPFMLGLTFEALIRYYEETGDARVPEAIRQAAEWLWYDSGLWDSAAGAFKYINGNFPGEDPPDPQADLNLLIAPVYAWLYHMTGDDRYRVIGDTIFIGGVTEDLDSDGYHDKGSCLDCNGKIFSQNYRWSFDFVRWRLDPPR